MKSVKKQNSQDQKKKKKESKPKKMWISYKTPIVCPAIIDLFAILKDCLNDILKNKDYTDQFAKIGLYKYSVSQGKEVKKMKGDFQKEIKAITGNPLKGKIWDAGNYFNYVCDNIIHLIQSHNEQIIIFNCLKKNNFKINDKLYDMIDEAKIKKTVTKSYLKTLSRAKTIDFPNHKRFKMDFSVDNGQAFSMDDHLSCTIKLNPLPKKLTKNQIAKGKQIDLSNPAIKEIKIQAVVPAYIRTHLMTGKFSKPVIYWDYQTQEPVFQFAYEIQPPKREHWENVLGVDLGIVKYYSAVAVNPAGKCSPEYIPTNKLQKLADKAFRIKDHIDAVYTKNQRAFAYNPAGTFNEAWTNRQRRREEDYYLSRAKLKRLKKYMAKLAAVEILAIALRNHCKEIHMENLHWLLAQGGKWNYSKIQQEVELLATEFGIKFYRINPAYTSKRHPFTGEKGKVSGRYIVFSDGSRYDRDHLAAINIALVNPGQIKNRKTALKKNTTGRIKRISRHSKAKAWRQRVLINQKSKDQIVLCSLGAKDFSPKMIHDMSGVAMNNVAFSGFQSLHGQKISKMYVS